MRTSFAIGLVFVVGLVPALVLGCGGDAEVVRVPEPPPFLSPCDDAGVTLAGDCATADGDPPSPWAVPEIE